MTLKEYQVYQQLCLVTIYLNMKMCISCTIHDPKIYLFKMYIILIFLENKKIHCVCQSVDVFAYYSIKLYILQFFTQIIERTICMLSIL